MSLRFGTRVKTANSGQPIKATVTIPPRLTLDVLPCRSPSGDVDAATFIVPLRDIAGYLTAPVFRSSPGRALSQITTSGWDRVLQPWGALELPLPILISARTNWVLAGESIEVFAEAFIIDGACRVESQLQENPGADAIFTVLVGLSAEDELELREALFQQTSVASVAEQKVGTDTPRLRVTTAWTSLALESDPFVVPTSRGYAPAVLIRRRGANHTEHLLIGARSLAEPIESLRARHGCLEGKTLRIRKTDNSPTAPYEIESVE